MRDPRDQRSGAVVREMTEASGNPSLQRRWVGTILQHLRVVIGLDHQKIAVLKACGKTLRDMSEVHRNAEPSAAGPIGQQQRRTGPGIMRNQYALDIESADVR